MVTKQGSVDLVNDPIAKELLESAIPARLAYVATDNSPRSIPIWFHWNGAQIVMGSPLRSSKVGAIRARPDVALTIDTTDWPYRVLQIRGLATVETVAGVVPEYALAAERYFGHDQGIAWVSQIEAIFSEMARISITPEWAAVLDFEARFPNAIEAAMAAAT